jgi:predicted phage gp36 major capsid-like protein
VYEALQEFDAATLEAEALWGEEIRERTNALRQCLAKLRAAIGAVVDDADASGAHFSADREFGVKMRQTVAATSTSENNPFTDEMQTAIARIEGTLRPHLRRQ